MHGWPAKPAMMGCWLARVPPLMNHICCLSLLPPHSLTISHGPSGPPCTTILSWALEVPMSHPVHRLASPLFVLLRFNPTFISIFLFIWLTVMAPFFQRTFHKHLVGQVSVSELTSAWKLCSLLFCLYK